VNIILCSLFSEILKNVSIWTDFKQIILYIKYKNTKCFMFKIVLGCWLLSLMYPCSVIGVLVTLQIWILLIYGNIRVRYFKTSFMKRNCIFIITNQSIICLSPDRSIASSKLSSPKSEILSHWNW
jgi:hypothetical protein